MKLIALRGHFLLLFKRLGIVSASSPCISEREIVGLITVLSSLDIQTLLK